MTLPHHPTPGNEPLGTCTLVGAGPGDPDLLTLQALKAIQSATVLLVDDLVSEAIVAYASPTARIVRVGKRGGCKSTPQEFIEKLMRMAVQEGETVVRLKGGDPFIFGRGGEEVEHLRAAGIETRVINGITAGLAGPTKPGHSGPDWRLLATTARDARLTLVIYMGVGSAAHIQQELLAGLPGGTPVAIIENASLPSQRHAVGTLDQLAATIDAAGLGSPSIIVVGNVVQALATLAPHSAVAAR